MAMALQGLCSGPSLQAGLSIVYSNDCCRARTTVISCAYRTARLGSRSNFQEGTERLLLLSQDNCDQIRRAKQLDAGKTA